MEKIINKLPDIIIVDLDKALSDLKLHLGREWLPIIDVEALLSGLISIFINPEHIEAETNRFIFWVITEFIENRDLSDIQRLYIRDVLIKTIQEINIEFTNRGFLNNYFPYGFKQILATGSVVLTKIDSS